MSKRAGSLGVTSMAASNDFLTRVRTVVAACDEADETDEAETAYLRASLAWAYALREMGRISFVPGRGFTSTKEFERLLLAGNWALLEGEY